MNNNYSAGYSFDCKLYKDTENKIQPREGTIMIRNVTPEDQEQILTMMELVKDDFAGYQEKEFLEALYQAIDKKEALLEEIKKEIAGLILFSKIDRELSFLAVHPDYRKRGVAKGLILKMARYFKTGDTIHVTTFRENDSKGIAARACYHACGFKDDEEIVVLNYPCQKMVLNI